MLAAPAAADGRFQIDGGGNGHGIGMSQYGAYGYAQHGKSYRFILGHYYQHTKLGMRQPEADHPGAARDGVRELQRRHVRAAQAAEPEPRPTPSRRTPTARSRLYDWKGRKVGTFNAPLSVGGPGPLQLAGQGSYRGWLEFRPDGAGAGVQTVNALHLEDYVRGVVSYEMPVELGARGAEDAGRRGADVRDHVDRRAATASSSTGTPARRCTAASRPRRPSTDAAVAATRGQVVTYHGKPAITYFSSSSGGHTENVEDAWPGSPRSRG